MLKSKVFWTAAIFFAAIIFIISLNSGRAFRGETDVLFVPKSEKAARNIDQILANAEILPKSLSFYDKLLELNSDIEDPTSGKGDDNRKALWNKALDAKRLGDSGIVRVGVLSDDETQAEILSQKTAADVVVVMSRYYDTQNDLDMRVIDGPLVFPVNENKIVTWIILSLLLGIVFGMIAHLFLGLAKIITPKTMLAKPVFFGRGEQASLWEKIPTKKEELAKEALDNVIASAEEAPYFDTAKKAGAPENLPIGDSFNFSEKEEAKTEEEILEEEVKKTHEATPEEVRVRLNKLLGGGM